MSTSFNQISVRKGLRALGLIAVLPLAVLGVLAVRTSADANATSQELVTNVVRTRAAGQLDMYHDALRGVVYEARARGPQNDDKAKRDILAELAAIQFDTDKAIARLQTSRPDPDIRQAMTSVAPALARYRNRAEELVQQALSSGSVESSEDEAFKKDFTELEKSLESLSKSIADDSKELEKRQQQESDSHMAWLGGGMLVLLMMMLGAAEFLSRQIWRQLGAEPAALRQYALKLAAGDLLGEVSGLDRSVRDNGQSVAGSMMNVRDDLPAAVAQSRDSSRIVFQASEEIVQASSRRTAEITTVIEVNGSVSELDRDTQQNSALVTQASAAADRLRDEAKRLSAAVSTFSL